MSKIKPEMNRHSCLLIGQILLLVLLSGTAWASAYQTVTPKRLKAMLPQKDFFLLDVHVPVSVSNTAIDPAAKWSLDLP